MTIGGQIAMALSWSVIILLCGFCFYNVLHTSRKNIHAPLDIDTGDLDDGKTHADREKRSQ